MTTATPHQQAISLIESGNLESARSLLEPVVAVSPRDAGAKHLLGVVLAQLNELPRAVELLEAAAKDMPDAALVHTHLGNAYRLAQRHDMAVRSYRKALQLTPSDPDTHYNLALALQDVGEHAQAEQELHKTLLFRPNHPEALYTLGRIRANFDLEHAGSLFRQALAAAPEMLNAQSELASVLSRLGQFSEAERVLTRALKRHPESPLLLKQKALLELMQGKIKEAEEIYESILEKSPEATDVCLNLGNLYQIQGKNTEALALLERALASSQEASPAILTAIANVKVAQHELGAAEEIASSSTMAHTTNAVSAATLARILLARGDFKNAISNYRLATELSPSTPELMSNLIYALHFDHTMSNQERFTAIQQWADRFEPSTPRSRPPLSPKDSDTRLRVGLVSGDFREHPVMRGLEGFLRSYDHNKLEIFAYSTSFACDETTERAKQLVDHWREVTALPAPALAGKIQRDQIDLLIDLSSHTAGNRLTTFALGAAPIQATWLGFFSTTGLTQIDYRLTDAVMDPPGMTEDLHSEKLSYLPAPCCYSPSPTAPEPGDSPCAHNGFTTFGALTQFNRYNDEVLAAWKEIFAANPTARLKVFSGASPQDSASIQSIKARLLGIGLSEERIDIRPWLNYQEFLTELLSVDVALDPFPYPGGITTMDALWMGIPTVTLAGSSSYQRIGASLMTLAELPDMIATSVPEYIKQANTIATQPQRLQQIRASLRQTLAKTALIDSQKFADAFTERLLSMSQPQKSSK